MSIPGRRDGTQILRINLLWLRFRRSRNRNQARGEFGGIHETPPVRQQALVVQAQEDREGIQIGLSHGGSLAAQPLKRFFDSGEIPPFTDPDLGNRPLCVALQLNTDPKLEWQSRAARPEAGPTRRVVVGISGHGVESPALGDSV